LEVAIASVTRHAVKQKDLDWLGLLEQEPDARPDHDANGGGRDDRAPEWSGSILAVGEGLVEITGDHVAILTDLAVPAEKIDEAAAEEARQRAQARLRERLSDAEVANVNAALARSLAQIRVKRRQRS
jgi:hypothetical protein